FYNVRADYKTSTELSEKLMDIARHQQDKSYLLGAHRALGSDLFWLGKFSESRYHQEEVITLYDPHEHENLAFVYWTDPKIHCLSYMGLILWILGFPSQASQKSHEAIALAHGLSHIYSLAIALFFSTWRCYMLKDLENTKRMSETLIELAQDQKFPIWSILGKAFYNWAIGWDCTESSIISEMNQTLSEHQATGMKQMRPCLLSMLSDLYRRMGYFEESLKTLEEAIILVDKEISSTAYRN
ncbi:MAG: hypothetical protein P8X90_31555, partial [Desulfobacterales bacterium]